MLPLFCTLLCTIPAAAVDYPVCERTDLRTKHFSIAWTDHKNNEVRYEPFCGDKVDYFASFRAPNRIRFTEDAGDVQSRFALLILDRDSVRSPSRKYAAVNIQAVDMHGKGFDPQAPASHIKVLQPYARPLPKSGCRRYYALLYRYEQTPNTPLPSINNQNAQQWDFNLWAERFQMQLVGIRYWQTGKAGLACGNANAVRRIARVLRGSLPPRGNGQPKLTREQKSHTEPPRGSRRESTNPPRERTNPPRASGSPPPRHETLPTRVERTRATRPVPTRPTRGTPRRPTRGTPPPRVTHHKIERKTKPLRRETTWHGIERKTKPPRHETTWHAIERKTAPARHETTWYEPPRDETTWHESVTTSPKRYETTPKAATTILTRTSAKETTPYSRTRAEETTPRRIPRETRPYIPPLGEGRPPRETRPPQKTRPPPRETRPPQETRPPPRETRPEETRPPPRETRPQETRPQETRPPANTPREETRRSTVSFTWPTSASTATTATKFISNKGWKQVRIPTEESLGCKKLNEGHHEKPKYGTKFANVGECQTACETLVKGCNAVNFCTRTKACFGKCQFQQCPNSGKLPSEYKKGMYSYLFDRASSGLTTKALTIATSPPTTTTAQPGWRQVRRADQESLGCTKLHAGDDHEKPRYDKKYQTVAACITACANLVEGCNAVNFCVKTAACHGKCQFQRCDLSLAKLPSEKHKGSESYVYHAVPTTTAARIRSTTAKRTTTEKFTSPKYHDTTRKAETKSTAVHTTTAARIRSTRAKRTTTGKFTSPKYHDTTRKAEAKSTAVHTTTAARIRSTRARRTTTEKFIFTWPNYYTTRKAASVTSTTTEDFGWLTYSYAQHASSPTHTPLATTRSIGAKITKQSRVVAEDDGFTSRSNADKTTTSTIGAIGHVSQKPNDFFHNENLVSVTIASAISGTVVLAVVVAGLVILSRKNVAAKAQRNVHLDSDLELVNHTPTPVRSHDSEAFLLNIDSGETILSQKFEETFVRF